MGADPSIYGLIQKPEGPFEQYGKVLNLKALMDQSKLQGLQTQKLEGDLAEEQGVKDYLKTLQPGQEADTGRLTSISPKFGIDYAGKQLKNTEARANIARTTAQTGEITAGHIAGAFAALARGNGSDEAVNAAEAQMAPLVGPEKARSVSQQLLAMPPETRLAYAVAQAGTHKTGQEALKLFFPQAHMQDTGGQVTPVSTSTLPGGPAPGTLIPGGAPIAKTQTPDSVATDARAAETLAETKRHHKAIEGDPEVIESTAQGIARGELAPLSAFALSRPAGQAIMGRVMQIHAGQGTMFDPTAFATRQRVENDFATGKGGQAIKSFNVSLYHLDSLGNLVDALKNGDAKAINKLGNAVSTQLGTSTAPTNFDAAKQIVGDEIVKAIVGAGGGVADREKAQKSLDNANSPKLLKGVIDTYKELMVGQLRGLEGQYKAGGGRKDFRKNFLSDEARSIYESHPSVSGATGEWSVVK